MTRYLRANPSMKHYGPDEAGQMWYRLTEPLVFVDTELDIWFEVPIGFFFNGASVPNILWGVLDSIPATLNVPGGGHDYLYRIQAQVIRISTSSIYTMKDTDEDRHLADQVIRAMCEEQGGTAEDDAAKVYYGVRVRGGGSYHRYPVYYTPPGISLAA